MTQKKISDICFDNHLNDAPRCPQGCVHGKCTSPSTCSCEEVRFKVNFGRKVIVVVIVRTKLYMELTSLAMMIGMRIGRMVIMVVIVRAKI